MTITLRNEHKKDYRVVEEITREAFWNLQVPGCDEHYLVHIMRNHPDFIKDLDFVAIMEDKIVGNIMYAKSSLVNEEGLPLKTTTFGPVSVLPELQRKGIGSKLIQHTIEKAKEMGYKAIIIYGHPHNYCKHGFVGSKSVNVSDSEGRFPYSLLVLELEKGCLKGHNWKYISSDVYYGITEEAFKEFDAGFELKEKCFMPSQEEFNIACRAFVE